jgi:hypothetical protein
VAELTQEQKDLAAAAIGFLEAAKAAAPVEPPAATGHLGEVDASVFQLGTFTPVLTDEDLAKHKEALAAGTLVPATLVGIVKAVQQAAGGLASCPLAAALGL